MPPTRSISVRFNFCRPLVAPKSAWTDEGTSPSPHDCFHTLTHSFSLILLILQYLEIPPGVGTPISTPLSFQCLTQETHHALSQSN